MWVHTRVHLSRVSKRRRTLNPIVPHVARAQQHTRHSLLFRAARKQIWLESSKSSIFHHHVVRLQGPLTWVVSHVAIVHDQCVSYPENRVDGCPRSPKDLPNEIIDKERSARTYYTCFTWGSFSVFQKKKERRNIIVCVIFYV